MVARAELLAPSESTTVTSVALGNGFFHLAGFGAYNIELHSVRPLYGHFAGADPGGRDSPTTAVQPVLNPGAHQRHRG